MDKLQGKIVSITGGNSEWATAAEFVGSSRLRSDGRALTMNDYRATQTLTAQVDHGLAGRVAVVTGASSGIGEATARQLARLGVSVILAARRVERLKTIAADIEAAGGRAYPLAMDASKADDVKPMVGAAEDQYGRLDYAVNNADVPGQGAFMESTVEEFDRIVATNLRGVFLAMQAEIPAMLKAGGGAIVNVSSAAGLVGVPGMSLYAMTKWGVIGLTKCVALEYAGKGLRINAISPGLTATEMLENATEEERDFC
jgi:NAD(P)-dependent dehydrogenase (short-subunit alcohol dehydrogenase family)